MPFEKVPCTESSLNNIGLSKNYSGSSLYINKRANSYLLYRSYWEYRELNEEIFIGVDKKRYAIEKISVYPINAKVQVSFTVLLENTIQSNQKVRLCRLASQALSVHLGKSPKLCVQVAKAKLKPRSLVKIKKIVEKLYWIHGKERILDDSLKIVIPAAISREEADMLHNHLVASKGRGLRKEHLLFFELLYSKYKKLPD